MPFVSMIDLDKSLTNNALFTDSDFDTSLPSMDNNLMKQINIQHQYSSSYHNNSAISLHQKLLLRTLNQLTNSTMFNGNNLHSLLSNSNGNLNTSIGNSPSSKQINYSRYKTELCRQFSENGECKYGDKCQFAHGFVDLKDVNRHPKYKTDFCKTFHSKGFCPYGPRCHFIHDINIDTPTKPQVESPAMPIPIKTDGSSLNLNAKTFLDTKMKNKSRKSTDEEEDEDDDDPISYAFQLATSEQSSSNLLLSPGQDSSSHRSRSTTLSSSSSSGISTTFNLNDPNNPFKLNNNSNNKTEDEQLTNSYDFFLSS